MNFAFATCDRKRALGFLKEIFPGDVVEDTEESVKAILDIVEADEVRICDPLCHGGQMILGTNPKPDTVERMRQALEKSGLQFGPHPDQAKGGHA